MTSTGSHGGFPILAYTKNKLPENPPSGGGTSSLLYQVHFQGVAKAQTFLFQLPIINCAVSSLENKPNTSSEAPLYKE